MYGFVALLSNFWHPVEKFHIKQCLMKAHTEARLRMILLHDRESTDSCCIYRLATRQFKAVACCHTLCAQHRQIDRMNHNWCSKRWPEIVPFGRNIEFSLFCCIVVFFLHDNVSHA